MNKKFCVKSQPRFRVLWCESGQRINRVNSNVCFPARRVPNLSNCLFAECPLLASVCVLYTKIKE